MGSIKRIDFRFGGRSRILGAVVIGERDVAPGLVFPSVGPRSKDSSKRFQRSQQENDKEPMQQRYFLIPWFGCAVFLSTMAQGQPGGGVVALRGEIESQGPATLQKYVVQVSECGDGGSSGPSTVAFDNKFEFLNLKPGCKVVRVLTSDERRVLHEERVTVESDGVPLVISLNVKPGGVS